MHSDYSDNRIERLKRRAKHCVCKYCGKELKLKHIIFSDINEAKVELYCNSCQRIELGVEREIYMSACNFVDHLEFEYYEGIDCNERKRQMNIAKVCEIMTWGCRNIGILNQDGFTVPLKLDEEFLSECLVLPSQEVMVEEEPCTCSDQL